MVSGEHRLKVAQESAQTHHAALQRELDARRLKASSSRSGAEVRIKEEPVSDSEEPMDTAGSVLNGAHNGYPSTEPPHTPTPELREFVHKMFRKHWVLCLSELKRLFNLHLASLPTGHARFGHVTDRVLHDAILSSNCKQILVPVSTPV